MLPLVLCMLLSGCAVQRYVAMPFDAGTSAKALAARSLDAEDLRKYIQAGHQGSLPLEWPPRQWTLDLLTQVAFHFNPDLEAARAKLAAAEAAVTTARQVPNPTLQVPLQYALIPKDGESSWTLGLALDVPIETQGKRGFRVAVASHQATAARLQLASIGWDVRSRLRQQLLVLWASTEKARLLQQQVELDQSLVALLQRRLREGYISAREVNQQQLALIQSSTDLLNARKEARGARIEVAGLLGLNSHALDGIELDLGEFVQPDPPLPAAELKTLVLQNRADVRAALEGYEASQSALQLEVAKQYPDIHLGPGYTFDQGVRKPGFDFTGIELPLFNRNEGPIAEASARRQEAAAGVRQAQTKAWTELDGAMTAYRIARDALREADQQFLVQQEQLAATRRAFKLGEDDRVSLEANRKTELSARLALFDASLQVQQALGRIEDAIQRPLASESKK
ncbi:TolC family protein [Massilia putida]|uniref:TolC family protein n=1 Tax=Massilia putida TaxID=1141883 RepID=UPI001474AE3F|nr:TolC family protein [Massilia putida]